MKRASILVILFAALLAGCRSPELTHSSSDCPVARYPNDDHDTCEVHPDLVWAASMSPTKVLAQAIARHDLRVLGIYGFTLEAPGLPEPNHCWREPLGVRPVEGTSDAIQCSRQARLQAQAEANACIYNRALLQHLRAHGTAPRCATTSRDQRRPEPWRRRDPEGAFGSAAS